MYVAVLQYWIVGCHTLWEADFLSCWVPPILGHLCQGVKHLRSPTFPVVISEEMDCVPPCIIPGDNWTNYACHLRFWESAQLWNLFPAGSSEGIEDREEWKREEDAPERALRLFHEYSKVHDTVRAANAASSALRSQASTTCFQSLVMERSGSPLLCADEWKMNALFGLCLQICSL